MKLLMIVNEDRFFLSHRKDIAVAAQKAGWDVTCVQGHGTAEGYREFGAEDDGFAYQSYWYKYSSGTEDQ